MATSGSSAGSPSGSHSGFRGRKARSLALLLLSLCGAAGLALWATRPPSDVPTSASSPTAGPATPPSARPGDVPLAGAGRPPSSRPATTPDAATDAGDAPSPSSATEPPSAPLPRTPVRVLVRQDGRPVAGAYVSLARLGDVRTANASARNRGGIEDLGFGPSTPAPMADPIRQRFQNWIPEVRTGSTSASGETTVELTSGHYRVRAHLDDEEVWAIGFSEADVDGEREVTIEVALEPAVRVEGVVVDGEGRTVGGVRVQAWAASDTRVTRASAPYLTNEDGRFSLLGFGREPHVVAVLGIYRSLWTGSPFLDTRPEPPPSVEGTRVTVAPGALREVRIVVTRAEPTVIELRGVTVRGFHSSDFPPAPDEPGAWLDSGGFGSFSTGAVPNGVLYVVVPEGVGCPWYVGQCHERAPFIVARKPGGLRVVTLAPTRVVSGTLAADPGAGIVRGFLRAPDGDRVQFGTAIVDTRPSARPVGGPNDGAGDVGRDGLRPAPLRTWRFMQAPSDAFDMAAYEGNIRRGPWVEVRAGTDAVEGLVVPVGAPPPSAPAPPADSPPHR